MDASAKKSSGIISSDTRTGPIPVFAMFCSWPPGQRIRTTLGDTHGVWV
jgi:hypothetical protein